MRVAPRKRRTPSSLHLAVRFAILRSARFPCRTGRLESACGKAPPVRNICPSADHIGPAGYSRRTAGCVSVPAICQAMASGVIRALSSSRSGTPYSPVSVNGRKEGGARLQHRKFLRGEFRFRFGDVGPAQQHFGGQPWLDLRKLELYERAALYCRCFPGVCPSNTARLLRVWRKVCSSGGIVARC